MTEPTSILLFGDQTGDYRKTFRRVLQIKENPLLTAFLDRSYSVLRQEVANQPRLVRERTTGFTSIADLVARYAHSEKPRCNAFESALTYISQIACFFATYGDEHDKYPSKSDTHVVGSCTGLLAAAVVSSSQNLVDLLPAAVEVVKVAYRVGSLVSEVGEQVEQLSTHSPSWSVVLPGLLEDELANNLKVFHEQKCISVSNQLYISAVSPSALTISGPSRIIDQFIATNELKDKKQVRIPIYGPYHAGHLYKEYDFGLLLQGVSATLLESHKARIPLSSTGKRKVFSAETLKGLLQDVTDDILLHPLRWDYVLESVVSAVKASGNARCIIVRFGPSTAGHSLVSALRQEEGLDIDLDDQYINESDIPDKDSHSSNRAAPSSIAICGLSGRFPDAADHEAFWTLLEKGLDLHREIPKDRFDVGTHVDPDGKRTNTSHTPYGCFIEEPGLFDPRFFNLSPREAAQTDPMQRLALVTAYEALEMSGYVDNRTPSTQLDRVGTFYGQTCDDWREIQAAQKVDTYFIPGGVRAFGPGKINYYFKFSGPSFSIDTACSSSLAAIQLACTSLLAKECDTALAGGMNILTNPDIFSGLSRGQFLSKKGPCATFDNDADGYCRADGVGSVVLKRLEDALADKDPVLAVISGAATNHSAEAVSITHPHAGAQEFLYRKILTEAGVDPHDVSYIEMHGTGTQAGDATEMRSVMNAFAPENRRRRPDQDLYLGAVKANAGHGEAASGITSLIKVLTMMEKNTIPPHCGIKGNINRTFPNLEERNVHIAFKPTPWQRPKGQKRRVFLNNFSAAGGNTALLLEDGPEARPIEHRDPRMHHVFAVSGRSRFSLKKNVESLIEVLTKDPQIDLPSLSYTTTARRIQHNYRTTVMGSDVSSIKTALESSLDQDVAQIPAMKRKVAFMFTGQGSHYTGMAKQLFTDSSPFRSDIYQYDRIARSHGFTSILALIDGSVTDISVLSPLVVQLGAVCIQMAMFRLWLAWGVEPTVVLGHSLGEYAALNAAGVLSVSDTIYLVGMRARLLDEKCHAGSHAMLAVKGSVASIGQLLDGDTFDIACINGPQETVISGTNVNIDLLCAELKERGFKSTKLAVPFAFHSAQVEVILPEFQSSMKGIEFHEPSVPVISPLLSKVITDGATFGSDYLQRHCRETVNFLGGIEAARHASLVADKSIWLEVGSHPLCATMVKSTLGPHVQTTASLRRNDDDWKTLAKSMCLLHDAGLSLDWSEWHRGFQSSHQLLRLPTYKWDNQNYWIDYKNDWTLTKGDASVMAEQEAAKPQFAAASVHRIVKEDLNSENPTIVVESDLSDPLLKEAIDGHEVNGFGLCPPSLYADMALTIADYVHKQLNSDSAKADLNACNMKVEKPLIAQADGPQLFRVSGVYDASTSKIDFDFYSVTLEGKKVVTHATCSVIFESAESWLAGWQRSQFMVKTRIESLMKGLQTNDTTDLFKRGTAYKLFGGLINYGHKYRGMEEVILNNAELEATSSVLFQTNNTDEKFYCSPYRIDSVAHISGFVMLGNENANPTKEVYVSHGWENCRFAHPLSTSKKYRSYVKMHQESAKMVVGDVYVFEDDPSEGLSVTAVIEGLRFHGIPRQLMDSILAAASGQGKTPKPAVTKAPQKQQARPQPQQKPKATAPSTASTAKPKGAGKGVTPEALKILADEIGVPVGDLTDGTAFSEMGVDSLMALNISGKFREALGVEISSSMFVDYPTINDLKNFLSQADSATDEPEEVADNSSSEESPSRLPSPTAEVDSVSSVTDTEEAAPLECGDSSMTTLIRATIAEETGVPLEDIDGSTNLASIGLDSLMSLTVAGKVRESTGHELPSEFFAENTTMNAIEERLGLKKKPASTSEGSQKGDARQVIAPSDSSEDKTYPKPDVSDCNATPASQSQDIEKKSACLPSATSILLQGSPTSPQSLFLFPDGSGSATSYSLLPPLSPTNSVAVYALNSPFLKTPASYPPSIPTLVSLFLDELRRRQPHGPYHLAGWSAGGVCAYEACVQLLSSGESVERLILIDAPCPVNLGHLPPSLHKFFDESGLLGPSPEGNSNGTPDWLIPHFDASVAALSAYSPETLPKEKVPRTYAIWAKDGVCKFPTDPRPKMGKGQKEPGSMTWLLENREGDQLKFNGWDALLGDDGIVETAMVAEANHFTMMKEGKIEAVGEFVKGAME